MEQKYDSGLNYVGKCANPVCPVPTKCCRGFGTFYPKKDYFNPEMSKCFTCNNKFNIIGLVFVGASSVTVTIYDDKGKIFNEFNQTNPSREVELKKEINNCTTISIQVNPPTNQLQEIPRMFALTPIGETEFGSIFKPECQVCNGNDPTPLNLACGHYICQDCASYQFKLQPIGGGKKFTTNYSKCGFCRSWLSHPSLQDSIDGILAIFEQRNRILSQADLISTDEKLLLKQNPLIDYDFLSDHVFFFCYECNRLYYGGEKNCGVNYEGGNNADRVCAPCSVKKISGNISHCNKHGSEFIAFKCKFCCNIASWFCGGTTHFCDPCHRLAWNSPVKPCTCGKPHAPNGQEHILGCVLCNSEAYKYV